MRLFVMGLLVLAGVLGAQAQSAEAASKLSGDLPRVIAEADADDLIPVSIVLHDQLTGDALRRVADDAASPSARRAARIAALKAHARMSQEPVLAMLA
ncbi:MAG: hypothetical protein HC882_02280, partial [Acidobacteria bacterium]|nr:hypothetical protein [Acidobacteriota bacterium]